MVATLTAREGKCDHFPFFAEGTGLDLAVSVVANEIFDFWFAKVPFPNFFSIPFYEQSCTYLLNSQMRKEGFFW